MGPNGVLYREVPLYMVSPLYSGYTRCCILYTAQEGQCSRRTVEQVIILLEC